MSSPDPASGQPTQPAEHAAPVESVHLGVLFGIRSLHVPGTPPGMLGLTRWQGTRKPSVGAEAVLGAVWVSADATQRMRWIPATSTDGVWSLDLPGVGELLIVPTEDIHAATPPDRVVTTVPTSGKKGFVILNPTGPRTVIAQPLDAPPGTSEVVVPPS